MTDNCDGCPYKACPGCIYQGGTGSIAARLDGCPSCVINSEVPYGAYQPPSGGLVALYKCTTCGHRWHASWAQESAA